MKWKKILALLILTIFVIAIYFGVYIGFTLVEDKANQSEQETTVLLVPAVSIESTQHTSQESGMTSAPSTTAGSQEQWATYRITAYCPCKICCGKWSGYPLPNGNYPEQGRTVASDLSILPRGTIIEIEGIGEYTVEDCGSAIQGYELDLYFDSHEDALAWGVKHLRVRIIK